jgi:hypothetical protein
MQDGSYRSDTFKNLHGDRQMFYRILVVLPLILLASCGGESSNDSADPDTGTTIATSSVTDASAAAGPITLTAADLDGFEKGIARETELVREAQQKSSAATTPAERGAAFQQTFETYTIPAAAPVTGLSAERYQLVRETIGIIMTTLDFQGKIDGPQSLDTSRADAAMKARLSSDPYASLDPASAEALKARIGRIAPIWIQYIGLTAVAG